MNRRTLFVFIGLAVLFGLGISRLFVLRFQKGDIYPIYSSLRADPLGAKAWHDSLREIAGLQTSRNLRPLHLLEGDTHAVIYYLGVQRRYFAADDDFYELEQKVRAGTRLVVAFLPETQAFDLKKEAAEEKKSRELTKKKEPSQKAIAPEGDREERWKIDFQSLKAPGPSASAWPGLDGPLPGHSFLAFAPKDAHWKTIYQTAGQPTVVERPYGLGSIVLVAEAYQFSNEALRKERFPGFLNWTLGGRTTVIFDETHLGNLEQPGVATLARRYRLHGAFAVCLFLGFLFVWRNSLPLVPLSVDREETRSVVAGQAAASGLLNLLRRSLSPKKLLATCLAEWKQTAPRSVAATDWKRLQALATDSEKSLLERYCAISQIIHPKKTT